MAKYLNYGGLVRYTELMKGLIGSEVSDLGSRLEDLITSEIGSFTDALIFQDLLTTNTSMATSHNDATKGDVYIVSPATGSTINVTYRPTTGTSNVTEALEAGDTLICIEAANGNTPAKWGVLQTNLNVSTVSGGATLSGTTSTTIAKVAGIDIKAKLSKNLGDAAACGVGAAMGEDGNLTTGSQVTSAVATVSSALHSEVTAVKNFNINTSNTAGGVQVKLVGSLIDNGPQLTVTANDGVISSAAVTNAGNYVKGSTVYSYVTGNTASGKTLNTSGTNHGVKVTLGGTVGNPTVGVSVTPATLGAGAEGLVTGDTVYSYTFNTSSATGSNSGVQVALGGTVGIPSITVAVSSEAVIGPSTSTAAKQVIMGHQVYSYVSGYAASGATNDTSMTYGTSNADVELAFKEGVDPSPQPD